MSRFTIIAAFIILLASPVEVSAEHVFLRDGSIVECKIIDETPEAYTARVKSGRKKVFFRKNIIRVLYTKLYLGRVYIYKTDGSILEAYVVEEDQDSYTVRKNIKKPAEFTIRRTDVSFISRDKSAVPGGKVPRTRGAGELPRGDGFQDSAGTIRYLTITARSGFHIPVGEFARYYDYGGGAALCVSIDNIFYPGFGMGVESGYAYLRGTTRRSQYTSLVPFLANMTYRFRVGENFAIEPRIGLGGSYNTLSVSKPIMLYFTPRYTTKKTVAFMFAGGIRFSYMIFKPLFLGIEADYSGIVEKSRVMGFLSALICVGVRL